MERSVSRMAVKLGDTKLVQVGKRVAVLGHQAGTETLETIEGWPRLGALGKRRGERGPPSMKSAGDGGRSGRSSTCLARRVRNCFLTQNSSQKPTLKHTKDVST
jgi:hypothetical protein